MNWEAIGAIGEVIGAVAVVATLVYLSVQVRQSSKVGKATVQQQVHDGHHQIFRLLIENQPLMIKFMSGGGNLDELEEANILNLYFMLTDSHQNYYVQHQLGLFDDESFQAMQPRMTILYGNPNGRRWLDENKEHYRKDFVKHIYRHLELDDRATSELATFMENKTQGGDA